MSGGGGKATASGGMVEASRISNPVHGYETGRLQRFKEQRRPIQEPERVWGNQSDNTSLTAPAYDASPA